MSLDGVTCQCDLDKSLWCNDLRAIDKCHSLKYCQTTEWIPSPYESVNIAGVVNLDINRGS